MIRDTAAVLCNILRVHPAFALGEGVMLLSCKSVIEFAKGHPVRVLDPNILGKPVLYLSIMAPVFFALTLIIDLDILRWLQRMAHTWRPSDSGSCCGSCGWQVWPPAGDLHPGSGSGQQHLEEDSDVERERSAAEASNGRHGDRVTVQHLRKVYPCSGNTARKVTVHDFSFGVGTNEIFALLGANGAGKTTTLGILSGQAPPTAGRVLLGGYDIETQRRQAQDNIGYCPQSDALLDFLSVTEHPILFGRLRGVPKGKLMCVVEDVIRYLGLTPHAHKPAHALSGGNKRNLSIGISIVGSPDVVFLDEPSSGLDLLARRQLWTCIADVAIDRSIILTTHHLEEVDALAHKVAIMSSGRMRCVGSLQHLKSKFSTGYTLQFRLPSDSQAAQQQHLASGLPGIVLEEEDFGRAVYHLPGPMAALFKMSTIFGVLQELDSSLGIEDYGVSQTTLEDVFMRITAPPPAAQPPAPAPGHSESIAWRKVRFTKQRSVDLTTDGLWDMPLNTGWVPVKECRLQDWGKMKKYVLLHKQGDVCPNGVPALPEKGNSNGNDGSE